MRGAHRIELALVALICVSAPALAGPRVEVDYDPRFDFSVVKTYAWKPGVPASAPETEQNIIEAVDAALQGKGLQRIVDGTPDVWVLTEAGRDEELQLGGESAGLTTPSGWGGYHDGSTIAFPLSDEMGRITRIVALYNKITPPFTEQDLDIGAILASYSQEALRSASATKIAPNMSRSATAIG